MLFNHKFIAYLSICILMCSCGAYFNQPLTQEAARVGEHSKSSNLLTSLPPAKTPVEVAVYNFSDQTGQYKAVENGSTFSTAVTQGATTILIKALGDSGWFIPIERENLSNLSTERNIIRNTKQEYIKGLNPNEPPLPPLLYAGLMLEGGIVSYDTNIITGGAGARYFGVGGAAKYRQDRITVYLRAVSTSNGEILKTIYVSKTILSQAVDVSLFRFVKFQRLLEAETGFTRNEPVQLAVKDAVEKAVHDLIVEGIKDGYWTTKAGPEVDKELVDNYIVELDDSKITDLYNRKLFNRRSKSAVQVALGGAFINGDYVNPQWEFNTRFGYKRYFDDHFNLNLNLNRFKLANENIFNQSFYALDANLEYNVLPFDKLSPFIFAGVGTNISGDFNNVHPKVFFGGGVEYLAFEHIGFSLFLDNNFVFSDDLDGEIRGERDDMYLRGGVGINFYIGNNNLKKQAERARKKELRQIKRENLKKSLYKDVMDENEVNVERQGGN
ncbi:CsgG/HfaB family protein [Bizionia paragorgiae]|uniref:Curli production assembly/transport component CsgG n=1 Tax=Bizionia paragorgiae TaxID=283786 RepID=A0A1H3VKK5_BIZPA|nr:CsgG/HfaB family protein [Bizionia paragorgiae]SDZ74652.1 curli production assembly/transport component CsgG [Bizionia paragorgiae]